eukprot:TRINITY_DN97206_c0_g1_i1.p1 TRINITY_DN97206_c0_g1~~TRINITY_DN97206_c0_g1_i1.p1  ORF type:complete len:203 (-),score=20.34 TRINITY_DN97206_c0_g1_i1:124-732(-)
MAALCVAIPFMVMYLRKMRQPTGAFVAVIKAVDGRPAVLMQVRDNGTLAHPGGHTDVEDHRGTARSTAINTVRREFKEETGYNGPYIFHKPLTATPNMQRIEETRPGFQNWWHFVVHLPSHEDCQTEHFDHPATPDEMIKISDCKQLQEHNNVSQCTAFLVWVDLASLLACCQAPHPTFAGHKLWDGSVYVLPRAAEMLKLH